MPTVSQIREHYDSLAFVYQTYWGDHIHHGLFTDGTETAAHAQVNLIERCASLAGVRNGESILDVGCGHGGTSIHLAKQYGCRVHGLTLSEKQASIASRNATKTGVASRVHFEVADADSYHFAPASFDVVWNCESSEHFADKPRYFQNVAFTLAPRGRLLLAAWTGSMNSRRVREVARAFLCPELWTASEYVKAIQAAGMSIAQCQDLTQQVVHTWEICRDHAHKAQAIVRLLPRAARDFIAGIEIILNAYQSGDLGYTILSTEPK